MFKIALLAALLTTIAAAQPPYTGVFIGYHYTGDTCNPNNPNGETGCGYVCQPQQCLGNDPNASYAWLTDSTGVNFPHINPYVPPPTINSSGPWNVISLAYDDGTMQAPYPQIPFASGTCTATGPQYAGPYDAIYTVQCQGTDSNGNPVSKIHKYDVHKSLGRYWQQPVEEGGAANLATLGFTVPPSPSTSSNVVGGVDDGH